MAENCPVLPGKFGLLVQLALGVICAVTLVVKKSREGHERTWFAFMLDCSKQFWGFGFVHVLNLLSSMALARYMIGDACDWYWLNMMIDTTLGVLLEYILLNVFFIVLDRRLGENAMDFRCGEYYDAQGHSLRKIYVKQLGLWLCCILGMKVIVGLILMLFSNALLRIAGTILWLVSWNSELKEIVVMILTPAIMNALQVWLTDNFIKKGGRSCSKRCCMDGCLRGCIDGLTALDNYITGEKEDQSQGRREENGRRKPLLLDQVFEEERAQLKMQLKEFAEANERLAEENEELAAVESQLLPGKDRAEAEAKECEERMRNALEKAYKVEQEKRLLIEEQNLLRERLAVKEDREKQLMMRIQQLEFAYKTAGSAANAVFAAEVSAATVAAESRANRQRACETETLALTDLKSDTVITEFCNSLPPLPPPSEPFPGQNQIVSLPPSFYRSTDNRKGLVSQSWQGNVRSQTDGRLFSPRNEWPPPPTTTITTRPPVSTRQLTETTVVYRSDIPY